MENSLVLNNEGHIGGIRESNR